jgi:predicted phosphoribosyltransferase
MSVELLDSLKEQTRQLSAQEKASLASFLLQETRPNGNESNPDNDSEEIRGRRMKWLRANRIKYSGQYVALAGDEVVATGQTRREAVQKAKNAGANNFFAVYVYPPDYVGELGGWS